MGGGGSKQREYNELVLESEEDNPELCRNSKGIEIVEDQITDEDISHIMGGGYDKVYSQCLEDSGKINQFKNKFLNLEGWKSGTTSGGIVTGKGKLGNIDELPGCATFGLMNWKRYSFIKEQQNKHKAKCCSLYVGGTPDQLRDCDELHCKNSEECKDISYLTSCLSWITSDILNKFDTENNETEINDFYQYINSKLNLDECSDWNKIENDKGIMMKELLPLINKILDKLKNSNTSDLERTKLIKLLSSDMIKMSIKYEYPNKVVSEFKEFCNNTTIFNKESFKDKTTDKYNNICNCFYDSTLNNDNPAYISRNKIKELKTMKGLPDELKKYFKMAIDIEPKDGNQCWFNGCIDNGIKPHKDCPNISIANCLSYIDFTNEGTIIANTINTYSNCVAKIDSKNFDLSNLDSKDINTCSQANYPILFNPDNDLETKYRGACYEEFNRDGTNIDGKCRYCDDIHSCVNTKNLDEGDECNLKTYNDTRSCELTGFESKEFIESHCKKYKCDWCEEDIDKLLSSSKFNENKLKSCDNISNYDKKKLTYRCDIINRVSNGDNSCEWCSDIDKFIEDNNDDELTEESPDVPKEGLSTLHIVLIIISVLFAIIVIGLSIYLISQNNNQNTGLIGINS